MYTEDEAKTKWCPFARVLTHTYAQDGQGRSYEGGYAYNRSVDADEVYMPPASMCIGSACMAWRDGGEGDAAKKADVEFARTGKRLRVSRVGFCGLAGVPS